MKQALAAAKTLHVIPKTPTRWMHVQSGKPNLGFGASHAPISSNGTKDHHEMHKIRCVRPECLDRRCFTGLCEKENERNAMGHTTSSSPQYMLKNLPTKELADKSFATLDANDNYAGTGKPQHAVFYNVLEKTTANAITPDPKSTAFINKLPASNVVYTQAEKTNPNPSSNIKP